MNPPAIEPAPAPLPAPVRVRRGRRGTGGVRWKDPRLPLTDAQSRLCAEWLSIAETQARKWASAAPWLEDEYRSAAMRGLIDAARNFEPEQGKSFYTYLIWHLRSARKDAAKRNRPLGFRANPAGQPVRHALDETTGGAAAAGDAVAAVDDRDELAVALRRLPARYVALFRELYWAGRTLREVAADWGAERSVLGPMHDQALRVLRGEAAADTLLPLGRLVRPPRFGLWVRRTRLRGRIRQHRLAEAARLSRWHLSAIERGLRNPSWAAQERLVAALAVIEKD